MTKKNWNKVTKALCELPLGKEINTELLLRALEVSLPNIKEILLVLVEGEYVRKEKDVYRLLRHPVGIAPEKCVPFNERVKQINNKEDVRKRKEKTKGKKSR